MVMKNLPLYFPAKEQKDVFIPLDPTVAELKNILKLGNNAPTYIRAPVATGKTTLAIYLATKYKNEFTMVSTAREEDQTRKNIVKAIRQSGVLPAQQDSSIDLNDALEALASANKTLIFDEAHLVFKYPDLVYDLIKAPSGWVETQNLKLLFFSAAGAGQGGSENIGTPPEVPKKYFWYPPMPDPIVLAERLEEAEVSLDSDSVLFFLKICSGHRGIFMKVMEWIRIKQSNLKSSRCWDIHDAVSYVKASIARSKSGSEVGWTTGIRQYMTKSRAVYVNGGFSDEIPDPFEQVLFGGSQTSAFLGQKHLRNLTIAGFLVPVRGSGSSSEFVEYNWDDDSVLYGVANSIMAEYYGDRFAADPYYYKPKLIKKVPNTAADLLARALPSMSFAAVVDNPLPMDQEGDTELSQAEGLRLRTSLSRNKLPHEDNYNQALAAMLEKLDYRVSTPFDKKNGKTDVVVTYEKQKTCAFECIMASRPPADHDKHASRFAKVDKPNYHNATLKGLITIGLNKDTVIKRVKEVSVEAHQLEIIGLVVSAAHDSYETYVRPDSSTDKIQGPFFFVCDRVAKSLEPGALYGKCITAATELLKPRKRKTDESV